MSDKRNFGLHTSADEAKSNVLNHIINTGTVNSKSEAGYAAFPNYDFKAPQGAAFAVARIIRELYRDKLITTWVAPFDITPKGREWVKAKKGGAA